MKDADLLDELTGEVLSYWTVKNAKRFLQNPPKYEAWQKFVEANSLFSSDFQKAELLFKESFLLDTTFFAPIIKLAILYTNSNVNHSNYSASDSLKTLIRTKLPDLTKWERLRWRASETAHEGDLLKAALLYEQLYQMDKSDANTNYNVGVLFWFANYPEKALSVLNDFDPRFRNRNKEISYMEWLIASIYNDIGAHQKAIETIQAYSYPKLYLGNATVHLTALIGLGKYDFLETQLANYLQEKDFQSDKENLARLYRTVCNQLLARNEDERLKNYATQFKTWLHNEDYITESLEHQIYIEIYLGNYNQAIALLRKIKPSEIAPNFRNELPMLFGFCYAKSGDFANANKQIEQVLNHNYVSRFHGLEYYNRAKIEVAMNLKDAAVESLKKAIGQGIPYGGGRFKNDGFLNPLFDYPSFEELVKPKG